METEQKSNGALLGLVVIIIILIVGGIYLWKTSVKENPVPIESNTIGTSDETAGLEADVNSVELENLDSEI